MATITFTCYACNQVLKVPSDKAGKKARCVKCGTILTIPADGGGDDADVVEPMDDEPAPRRGRSRDDDEDDDRPRRRGRDEEEDEDRPRRRGRDDDADDRGRGRDKAWGSWPKVALGFTMHTVTAAVLAGYAGLGLIALLLFFIGELATSIGMLNAGRIIGAIGGIIFLVVAIPALIAYIFCMFSPSKRGAMVWAIVVLSLGVISLVFRIIWVLIPAINSFSSRMENMFAIFTSVYGIPIVVAGGVAGTIIVSILILLVIYAEYVLLPVYIGAVGKALKDRYLPGATVFPMILAGVALALKLLVIILLLAAGGATGPGGSKAMEIIIGIVSMLSFGALLAFGLMYMRLSMQAKSALP